METTQKLGKKNNKNEKVLKIFNYFFIWRRFLFDLDFYSNLGHLIAFLY